jgi:hypothetical protein
VRLPARTGLLLALLVAVVALPTIASGALSGPAAPAANSQNYEDSTGENPAAPDITTMVVSNDDAGIVSFRINVPNRPTFTRDILVEVLVDTDNNPATGDPDFLGADYAIELFQGEAALFRWDGEGFTRTPGNPPATSLLFSYQGGATIRISATELGNTKRFRFSTFVISGITFDDVTGEPDFTNAVGDIAPAAGAGLYSYEVKITPATLVARRFTQVPAKPAAGKPFTLRLVAARSDTGAVIQNGRVTCVGRAGNARLKAQIARVVAGAATCTWNIPPAAKGKTFRGSVKLGFEGLNIAQAYAGKIR